jgi:hypothetical protein
VDVDELHRAGERGDPVGDAVLEAVRASLRMMHERRIRPGPHLPSWRKRHRTLQGRPAHIGSTVALRQQSELIEVICTPHQAFLVEREDTRPEDVEPVADDERRATIDSL